MQYKTIALFLPTYHRIEKLTRCLESALKQAANPSCLRFAFCVNESDQETISAIVNWSRRSFLEDADGTDCRWEILKEETIQPNLAYYYNLLFDGTRFNRADTIVSMLGDDMVFDTYGWDTRVLAEINKREGKAIVYLNDDYIAHEKLAVNLFLSRDLVLATEKPFMCSRFHADMIDVVWHLAGQMTQMLVYLNDVILRHDHETRKSDPATRDTTHARLAPIQKLMQSKEHLEYARAYATVIAANLIDKGYGSWDLIN